MQEFNYFCGMKHRLIRPATMDDMAAIESLVRQARQTMRANGNSHQWPEGYPKQEKFEHDISRGDCWIITDDGQPVGVFCLLAGPDDSYDKIDGRWLDDDKPYHVIHRIASATGSHGIFGSMMRFCLQKDTNLRMDTHRDNTIMQHLLQQWGFSYCGIIHLSDTGEERLAYQLLAKDDTL